MRCWPIWIPLSKSLSWLIWKSFIGRFGFVLWIRGTHNWCVGFCRRFQLGVWLQYGSFALDSNDSTTQSLQIVGRFHNDQDHLFITYWLRRTRYLCSRALQCMCIIRNSLSLDLAILSLGYHPHHPNPHEFFCCHLQLRSPYKIAEEFWIEFLWQDFHTLITKEWRVEQLCPELHFLDSGYFQARQSSVTLGSRILIIFIQLSLYILYSAKVHLVLHTKYLDGWELTLTHHFIGDDAACCYKNPSIYKHSHDFETLFTWYSSLAPDPLFLFGLYPVLY